MTQDHSSKLSFSIEESVWLNKGQEVDEIVSLSLDPDITVQESGDYVLIRGGLKLTGEYRTNGNSNPAEKITSLSDQVGFRSIEEVTVNEDGTGEIRHQFPIDVTIPQERINNLDDIYVIVESFDYDLPERGCIQLTADVSITGMSNGKIVTENNQGESQLGEVADKEDRSFHYEAYNRPDSMTEESVEAEVLNEEITERVVVDNFGGTSEHSQSEGVNELREPNYPGQSAIMRECGGEKERGEYQENIPTNQDEAIQVELSEEIENIDDVMGVSEAKTPAVAFGVIKDRPKQATTAKKEMEQPKEEQEQSYGVLKSLAGNRMGSEQQQLSRAEVDVVEVPLQEETTEDMSANDEDENALYLTKMLTKGEEEFKKLKMCIIQEDETLDIIANRYEVNQSALIRVNRLNDSNVETGQIIYIPTGK